MKQKLLLEFVEQVIEQELSEAMLDVADALQNNMALYVQDKGAYRSFILYNQNNLLKLFSNPKFAEDVKLNPSYVITGVIDIQRMLNCSGVWVVVVSAANKGYGPLMYYIAFSSAGKDGLISDRYTVTNKAMKVWQQFATTYKNLFDITPLDPENEECLYVDGSNKFLNQKYVLRVPFNTNQLVQRHEDTTQTISKEFPEEKPTVQLNELANKFFNLKNEGLL